MSIILETKVGTHEDSIKCVEYCPDVNVVVTGSWDSNVKLWDPRTPNCTGSFAQPERVRLHASTLFNKTPGFSQSPNGMKLKLFSTTTQK